MLKHKMVCLWLHGRYPPSYILTYAVSLEFNGSTDIARFTARSHARPHPAQIGWQFRNPPLDGRVLLSVKTQENGQNLQMLPGFAANRQSLFIERPPDPPIHNPISSEYKGAPLPPEAAPEVNS